MPDKDYAVLASRVLSYLKRKFGKGRPPDAEETKAAIAALQLLATVFPASANNPEKMFEELKRISRANGDLGNASELEQMKLQMYMNKQAEMYQTISNLMRSIHDTQQNIIGNLR